MAAGLTLRPAGSGVVIIDADRLACELLDSSLRTEGFVTRCFADGATGLAAIHSELPAIVLLEMKLPDTSGIEICRSLRASPVTAALPLIFVSRRRRENDAVLALSVGADDFIRKPIHIAELLARMRAVLRRTGQPQEPQQLCFGAMCLDNRRHSLSIEGSELELTATEFRLLAHLMSSPGSVFSRELLIDVAIGENVSVSQRTVDTHLGSIRRKLGSYRDVIQTVWGVGYRFEPLEEEPLAVHAG